MTPKWCKNGVKIIYNIHICALRQFSNKYEDKKFFVKNICCTLIYLRV
nr:MAG TPA: hypothetical protein [Bacteriophage sp.]